MLDYKTGSEEMKLFNQISDNNILFQNLDESILSEEDLQAVWSEKRKAFLNFKYQTVLYYFACLYARASTCGTSRYSGRCRRA